MSSMFDFDDSINLAYNAKIAGKNLVVAKHEVLSKTGDFLFLAHSDREFALRCQMAEADIESAALRKMANVSDSKAKLVRALHEEWKLRHANCEMCKTAGGLTDRLRAIIHEKTAPKTTPTEEAAHVVDEDRDYLTERPPTTTTYEGPDYLASRRNSKTDKGDQKKCAQCGKPATHKDVHGYLELCDDCVKGKGKKKDEKKKSESSKIAHGDLEPQILQELEEIEQMMQCMCGASCKGQFNGTPHCMPGEGCCANATPGACAQCGQSFHGHDICSCKGGCGVQWSPADESPADKIADHDQWAAETNHGRGGSKLFNSGSETAQSTKVAGFIVEAMPASPRSAWGVKSNANGSDIMHFLQVSGLHDALRADRMVDDGKGGQVKLIDTLKGGTPVIRVTEPYALPEDLSSMSSQVDPQHHEDMVLAHLLGHPTGPAELSLTTNNGHNSMYGHPGSPQGVGERHALVQSYDTNWATNSNGQPVSASIMPPRGSHSNLQGNGSTQVHTWPLSHLLAVGPDTPEHIAKWFNGITNSFQQSLLDQHGVGSGRSRKLFNKSPEALKTIGRVFALRESSPLSQTGGRTGTRGPGIVQIVGVSPIGSGVLKFPTWDRAFPEGTAGKTNIGGDLADQRWPVPGPVLIGRVLHSQKATRGSMGRGSEATVTGPNDESESVPPENLAWFPMSELGDEVGKFGPKSSRTNLLELARALRNRPKGSSSPSNGPINFTPFS